MENQIGIRNYFNIMKNRKWKIRIERTEQGVRIKTKWFKDLNIRVRNAIIRLVKREVDNREVVITIKEENTDEILYIPKREFRGMVKKRNEIEFTNAIVSIGNNDNFILKANANQAFKNWSNVGYKEKADVYHTTKSNVVQEISDIDPSKSTKKADFGPGSYLTPNEQFATDFKNRLVKQGYKSAHIVMGNWQNQELKDLIDKITNYNGPDFDSELTAVDKNKKIHKFKVKVFCGKNTKWVKAILNGWTEVRVPHCDIVIGPVTVNEQIGYIRKKAKEYENLKKAGKFKEIESLLQEVQQKIMCQMSPEDTKQYFLQICCYKREVLQFFEKV